MIFMKKSRLLSSVAAFLILQPAAWGLPGLSEPLDENCQKDVASLAEKTKCSSECHDESPMDCLQENIKDISEVCRKKITSERKEWEEKKKSFVAMQKACGADFTKHKIKGVCHKDTIFNLMVKKDEITKGCKDQANKHIKTYIKHLRAMD